MDDMEEMRSLSRRLMYVWKREIYCKIRREQGLLLKDIGMEINRTHGEVIRLLRNYENDLRYEDFRRLDAVMRQRYIS